MVTSRGGATPTLGHSLWCVTEGQVSWPPEGSAAIVIDAEGGRGPSPEGGRGPSPEGGRGPSEGGRGTFSKGATTSLG